MDMCDNREQKKPLQNFDSESSSKKTVMKVCG